MRAELLHAHPALQLQNDKLPSPHLHTEIRLAGVQLEVWNKGMECDESSRRAVYQSAQTRT